jgi:hypothetical protein
MKELNLKQFQDMTMANGSRPAPQTKDKVCGGWS